MAGQLGVYHRWKLLLLGLLASSQGGCSTVSSPPMIPFLWQAAKGQLALSNRARKLEVVIKDERTPKRTRDLLSEISKIKSFGESHGLKPTRNYESYVSWHNPYVSYVVSACPELSFDPLKWSFPIVGSFTYLGWFDPKDAEDFANKLKSSGGLDVDVRGARAFSTLGWFRDPIISCMIGEGEEALLDLVDVVLHESVHATVYIKGQSSFNESLAEFLAKKLTDAYFQKLGDQRRLDLLKSSELKNREYEAAMHGAYLDLDRVFRSRQPDEQKRVEKTKIYSALKATLQSKFGMKREINNATLVQFKTYRTEVKEFEEAWSRSGGDSRVFLSMMAKLRESDFSKPQQEDYGAVIIKALQGR